MYKKIIYKMAILLILGISILVASLIAIAVGYHKKMKKTKLRGKDGKFKGRNLSNESLIETETSLRKQPTPENYLAFRIIVVGAKGVGKTSIARQFTERKWFDEPC